MTIQQHVNELRRQHLLDAAVAVFAAKGFERATIRDVARRAGVADGTIYNYFPSKSALLLGILHRLNETERRAADLARARGAGDDALYAYFRHRFDVLDSVGLDALRVVLSELLSNAELRQQYQHDVLEPTFALADAQRPALQNRFLAATVLGSLVLRLLDDPVLAERWSEVPGAIADFSLHGVEGAST